MNDLKPCPICGGAPMTLFGRQVRCSTPFCLMGIYTSIPRWNTRPAEDRLRAQKKKLATRLKVERTHARYFFQLWFNENHESTQRLRWGRKRDRASRKLVAEIKRQKKMVGWLAAALEFHLALEKGVTRTKQYWREAAEKAVSDE